MQMTLSLRAFAGVLLAAMLATPAMAQGGFFGSSSRAEGETAVRMNRVEEQMRALTGQIEELSHQVRELQDQLRRAQEDTEYRFQELEGGGAPRNRSDVDPSQRPQGSQDNVNTAGSAQLGVPPQSLGQLEQRQAELTGGDLPVASGRPLDLSALATGNGNTPPRSNDPLPGVRNSGDPAAADGDAIGQLVLAPSTGIARDDYDRAYNQVLSGDYALAIQSFQQFLADYPDDPLASNAQYWMGESYYSSGQYREAADAFLKTYTDYPDTTKAPDSLLKLGLSLGGLGQRDAACATYSELLAKYPDGTPAVLNRARAEQKSAGCS